MAANRQQTRALDTDDDRAKSERDLAFIRRMEECQRSIEASTGCIAVLGQGIQQLGGYMEMANKLQIMGINGPSGFAERVYDLVRMKTDETLGANDKYFVYHPDNFWYPAFHILVERNGLSDSFCMKSDDLDTLCLYMQTLRSSLPPGARFRLLIPAWDQILMKEAVHFPEELQPFCIEGTTYGTEPFVTMNVPRAQRGLLRGIRNKFEPEWLKDVAKAMSIAAFALGLASVGCACGRVAHYVSPEFAFGPFAVAGLAAVAVAGPVKRVTDGLEKIMRPAAPRILGSDRRL